MFANYKRSSNLWSQGWVVSELFDVQSPTPTLSLYPLRLTRNLSGVVELLFPWIWTGWLQFTFLFVDILTNGKRAFCDCCPDIRNWCPYCCPVHRQFILLGAKPSFLFQPFWEWMVIGLVNCFKQKPFCTCFVVKESFFIYLFILSLITYI
jgi:hypothetical protein